MANPIKSLPQPLSLPPHLILQRCRRAHQYQSSLSSTEAQEGYGIRRDPISVVPSHLQHDREQCFNMHRRLRGRDHVFTIQELGRQLAHRLEWSTRRLVLYLTLDFPQRASPIRD